MEPVPDRVRLRRIYLWKKGTVYSKATAGVLLCLVLGIVVFLGGLAALALLWQNPLWTFSSSTFLFGMAVVSLWLYWKSRMLVQKAKIEVARHYAPPVTLETLPAGEVLVRGSNEPLLSSQDQLLRPVTSSRQTPAEELLRPTPLLHAEAEAEQIRIETF